MKIERRLKQKEFLVDFLSTATYGSFWAQFGKHKDTPDDVYQNAKANNECREEVWADVLLNGGFFLVVDAEEGDEYKLSLKDFIKGASKLLEVCPHCNSHNVDYLTRIIGYLKRVSSFNEARQVEAKMRYYNKE